MTLFNNSKHASLKNMLITLTLLCVVTQIIFFAIHSGVSSLIDSLVQGAFIEQLYHPAILLPVFGFIFIQFVSYILLIAWLWFIASANGELFKFFRLGTYYLGIFFWITTWVCLFALNSYFFSHSFFAVFDDKTAYMLALFSGILLIIATMLAYIYSFIYKQHHLLGGVLLGVVFISMLLWLTNSWSVHHKKQMHNTKTNIILIGLDSLRPDFVNYFGERTINTPNIDHFLKNAVVFTNAYTPLARTFPAWVSILTAKYPKHSHARNNLANQSQILLNDNLAKRLQKAGYETIYATDEKRFSNITPEFGFDKLIGPSMGVNDFILGGLSDFPLTNLLINTSFGRILFPYNYANRAAAITYEPDSFLTLVKSTLAEHSNKPLFLAIHFCVSHWPYTWARDHESANFSIKDQYQNSVEEVDRQLGELMTYLKENGLLDHSLVVLLSDHGTGLGLPFDRVTAKENYLGDTNKLKWMPIYNLSNKSPRPRFDTSYGQGTDVLSLTQQHVILAFQGVGATHHISNPSSLMDIAPTVLDYLKLPPLQNIDGIAQNKNLLSDKAPSAPRALFFESGYAINEIEKSHIDTNKVIQKSINGYQVNPKTALLTVSSRVESLNIKNKQRAMLLDNWLLARYPAHIAYKLAREGNDFVFKPLPIPVFYVLVNLNTKQWTIDFSSPLAKPATVKKLMDDFQRFYGDEVSNTN